MLNKIDLADGDQTEKWKKRLTDDGVYAAAVNCSTGTGINRIFRYLDQIREERDRESVRKRPAASDDRRCSRCGKILSDQ